MNKSLNIIIIVLFILLNMAGVLFAKEDCESSCNMFGNGFNINAGQFSACKQQCRQANILEDILIEIRKNK